MPELPTTPADERTAPLRVLLVDDSADLANMLARWMRSQPGLEVVGVLGSAAGLAAEVVSREADVVMLDLVMAGPPPLEAIRGILARAPGCRVLVFSGYDDAETRGQALAAGAYDLVSKNLSPREIVEAIRRAGLTCGGGA